MALHTDIYFVFSSLTVKCIFAADFSLAVNASCNSFVALAMITMSSANKREFEHVF